MNKSSSLCGLALHPSGGSCLICFRSVSRRSLAEFMDEEAMPFSNFLFLLVSSSSAINLSPEGEASGSAAPISGYVSQLFLRRRLTPLSRPLQALFLFSPAGKNGAPVGQAPPLHPLSAAISALF
eukprot:Plantae.Rhodophyta-Purpureofilum_apyrenoidigerum.ctg21712.p1 GENE.Plantae.Rhodophyta-Purpureofilum_apyrenoidigerum.ctg21712~~Plantae.Rhodophyta-Purpureofilum_apyrenoidigerum.ctg21712.p1  ORF type:complete len:125 (+),score=3.10 Plantae.Rhodophyta-Purpureofilum_apyrenoidigerum.ctg21712:138-512(+)